MAMWICSTCGEAHEDRFKDCWKCAGTETEQAFASSSPRPPDERKLRSFGSILSRAGMAFVVGAFLGVAIASRTLPSEPADVLRAGLIMGLVFAGVAGLFVWVFYPYEPKLTRHDATGDADGKDAPGAPID